MKKQILLLTFLVLAMVFTDISISWAQNAVNNTDARPISCVDPANPDPLQPIAGVPYRYEADVTPLQGAARWFVTTDISFITGGAFSATEEAIGGNYIGDATDLGVTDPVAANPTGVDITWKSEGLSQVDYTTSGSESPLFVGIMYDAPADACANNIQVWKIEPIIAFTLDITNVEFDGTNYTSAEYDTPISQCFDEVQEAEYDYSTNTVLMDYGTQTLYYEIIAANFSSSFDFLLNLSGLDENQTADVSWGYTPETANTNLIGDDVTDGWELATGETALTSETNTSSGVSIYVQVVISNNNFEGLSDIPITLALDGTDSAGNTDVNSDCAEETAFADAATQTLEHRPTIDNPNPTPFVPKN